MRTGNKVVLGGALAVCTAVVIAWYAVNLVVVGLGDPAIADSNVAEGTFTLTTDAPRQELNVQLLLDGREMSIEDHLWFGASDRDLVQVEMHDRDGPDVVTVELDTRKTSQDVLEVDWTMGATIDAYGSLILTVE